MSLSRTCLPQNLRYQSRSGRPAKGIAMEVNLMRRSTLNSKPSQRRVRSADACIKQFRIRSLEFEIRSSEFGVQDSGFGVRSSKFGTQGLEFGPRSSEQGLEFEAQHLACGAQWLECSVQAPALNSELR